MPRFTFFVDKFGKLPTGIASTLTSQLKKLAGKKVTIELKEEKDKRSLDANAFLWSVVYTAIRQFHLEQGVAKSIDDIHEEAILQFAPLVERTMLDGTTKLSPQRTSQMNKEEFNKYILAIEVTLNEFGIYFPAREGY